MCPFSPITAKICYLIFLPLFVLATFIGCQKKETQPESTDIVSGTAGEGQHAFSGNLNKMQGRWQSKDDAAYVIEIKGDQFVDWNNNEKVGTGTITFVNNCEEQANDPESKYFMVIGESEEDCYYLIRLEEAVLEYSYLPRGNTLSFTKVE